MEFKIYNMKQITIINYLIGLKLECFQYANRIKMYQLHVSRDFTINVSNIVIRIIFILLMSRKSQDGGESKKVSLIFC